MPALPIISADERLRSPAAVKGQIWGRYGSGKTWQVKTLMASTALSSGVLVLDAEAGLLSIQDVPVDVISLRSWTDARDIACFFGGANPAFRDDQPYSEAHYQHAVERYGDPKVLERYSTVFIDSISVVSKLCLNWCKGQPQAVSERSTGKPEESWSSAKAMAAFHRTSATLSSASTCSRAIARRSESCPRT